MVERMVILWWCVSNLNNVYTHHSNDYPTREYESSEILVRKCHAPALQGEDIVYSGLQDKR